MNKNILSVILLFLSVIVLSSCEKVIDVDLNSSDPRTVIEAAISDQPGPYYVRLSKSVNFDQSNNFPPISGAVVMLSDDAGNSEILTEVYPGVYATNAFPQGIPGREYSLSINAEGKAYFSKSKMLSKVEIDTLSVESTFFGIDLMNLKYKDPSGENNFYRFIEIQNGKRYNDIYIDNDKFRDGNLITQTIYAFNFEDSTELVTGDTVTILLQSIDSGAYEYYRTLSQILDGGGELASPANPTSNISNGALGFFSAYSESKKTIVIP